MQLDKESKSKELKLNVRILTLEELQINARKEELFEKLFLLIKSG